MNVEAKLSKALGKDTESLVIKAADRDTVLNEISARMARYEKFDMDMYNELKALRQDVKDTFNKGLPVGDEMMDQLYFLDPKTMDLVEKMTRQYNKIITPDDFKTIANIMSEKLASQVPILKDFTRFFGRLAEDFVTNAKPSASSISHTSIMERAILGAHSRGKKLPRWLNRLLAIKDEPLRDKMLRRIPGWLPGGPLDKILFGVEAPATRRTGFKIGGLSILGEDIVKAMEVAYPNKLPKTWTHLPWVNFDGKIVEQHFLQEFEEKLVYKTADGKWVTNIIQVPQKTDPTWWEELRNKSGKINEIVDAQKARTAFAVNGNHSNDATLVKRFHLWGRENGIGTSTVHDAFFTNAADMINAKAALKKIYARTLDANSIKATLDEMLARGLPREIYNKYMDEAIEIGLIPVAGRSRVGGRLLTEEDILTKEEILRDIQENFEKNLSWYGIG